MTPLVLTFLAVIALVYGIYWVLVERQEGAIEAALRGRLRRGVQRSRRDETLLKDRDRLSDVGMLDQLLTQAGWLLLPVRNAVAQSGLQVTVGTVVLASFCAAAVAYLAAATLFHLPLAGVLFACGAMVLPYEIVRARARQRLARFEEQFPEAMDLLARAMRAGHALTTGLSMVAEELGPPVGPEFRRLFDEQNFGRPLPQALKAFAERVPIVDSRFFVTAVLTQREAGGNLSEVLDNLASIIRDRFRVKRQVRVLSAHGRITGWVLSVLPIALGLFLAATSGNAYRSFYTDPLGIQMIAGALALEVLGVLVISRIVRIDY